MKKYALITGVSLLLMACGQQEEKMINGMTESEYIQKDKELKEKTAAKLDSLENVREDEKRAFDKSQDSINLLLDRENALNGVSTSYYEDGKAEREKNK